MESMKRDYENNLDKDNELRERLKAKELEQFVITIKLRIQSVKNEDVKKENTSDNWWCRTNLKIIMLTKLRKMKSMKH